jgi:hypothetical protein
MLTLSLAIVQLEEAKKDFTVQGIFRFLPKIYPKKEAEATEMGRNKICIWPDA